MIVLHVGDGTPVYINVEQIVSLRGPQTHAAEKDKSFPGHLKCMVNLVDGKFVTVIETCEEVRKILKEEAK